MRNIVAYLGPEGTFSYQAATQLFSVDDYVFKPVKTITAVFQTVITNQASFGVVPVKNTIGGVVQDTEEAMQKQPVTVIKSFDLAIKQQLLSWETSLETIHTVLSHQQGILQCKKWLAANLPHATVRIVDSTLSGLTKATKGSGIAVIGPATAVELYGGKILVPDIQDSEENRTTFYAITAR